MIHPLYQEWEEEEEEEGGGAGGEEDDDEDDSNPADVCWHGCINTSFLICLYTVLCVRTLLC